MATTTPNDFKIYAEWVQSGYLEKIARNVNGFNAASNNTINLTTAGLVGNYKEIAFFKELAQADLIHDRDKTATGEVTPAKMTQVEDVIPYLPSRFGPYETTRSAFLDIGKSPEEFSQLLGQALADAVMADMLDTSFAAMINATTAAAKNMVVGSNASSLTYDNLIDGMAAFGDRIGEIGCFVMRGKDYFELMKNNVTAATIDSIAGATLMGGTVATLGKPVLVMDSPSLELKDGAVLALTNNAITCIADSDMFITTQIELLKENIIIQWQGESQYGLDLKGFAYDKTKAVTRANIKTGANWSKVVTSDKNLAGAIITTKK